MADRSVFQLKCSIQQYKWGKIGFESEVAKLSSAACSDITIDEESPYAELWMGTHPRGPSVINGTGKSLDEWISNHPECLGIKSREKFGDKLPFLFKVLSVNKALSIQAHPNKEEAEILYKTDPEHYPDPNHKPEIAIALTKFEALCGFRPISEILTYLHEIPEFANVIGDENIKLLESSGSREALKNCFEALMTTSDDKLKDNISSLLNCLKIADENHEDIHKFNGDLFLRIHSQFPGDVGCFGIYFFNYITLEPGESIFLPANEPHAYLYGDCIECMACSDNVLRCGLTPKFKDVPRLIEMLTFSSNSSKEQMFTGDIDEEDSAVTIFNPPIPDFAVRMMKFQGRQERILIELDSASILLVVDGEVSVKLEDGALDLQKGSVLFISCNSSLKINQLSENLLMFQAYTKL